jgi:hypothetical protein
MTIRAAGFGCLGEALLEAGFYAAPFDKREPIEIGEVGCFHVEFDATDLQKSSVRETESRRVQEAIRMASHR